MSEYYRKSIKLPPLPAAWNKLTACEMEKVHILEMKRKEDASEMGVEYARHIFRLNCFMLFSGLKAVKQVVKDDGGTVYLFRRKGLLHFFERIPMRA